MESMLMLYIGALGKGGQLVCTNPSGGVEWRVVARGEVVAKLMHNWEPTAPMHIASQSQLVEFMN